MIGQDGAVCDKPTAECQKLNRRVHMEMRKATEGRRAGPARAGRRGHARHGGRPGGSHDPDPVVGRRCCCWSSPRAGPGPGWRVTEGTLCGGRAAQPAPSRRPCSHRHRDQGHGLVVRATVRQAFTNPSQEWAEGVYVFPLPEDAAVDHLRMKVGERVIEGVIKEREAAKRDATSGEAAGQRPGWSSRSGRTSSPRRSRTSRPARRSRSRSSTSRRCASIRPVRLRFPTLVGPRYIPAAGRGSGQRCRGWARSRGGPRRRRASRRRCGIRRSARSIPSRSPSTSRRRPAGRGGVVRLTRSTREPGRRPLRDHAGATARSRPTGTSSSCGRRWPARPPPRPC